MNKKPLSYACAEDVPFHKIRANQSGILLSVLAFALIQQFWILIIPLIVQMISRTYGIRYNIFVRLISPLLPISTKTESRELLRFNNLLAILFLLVSIVGFILNFTVLAYTSLIMLTAAVVLALSGFCLGCFIYFQFKILRSRIKRAS